MKRYVFSRHTATDEAQTVASNIPLNQDLLIGSRSLVSPRFAVQHRLNPMYIANNVVGVVC